MNQERVDFFVRQYRGMSDEELTNLLIDRHDRLSDEANEALTRVLDAMPDKAAFEREIRAKVDDLNAQANAAAREAARLVEHARQSRRAMGIFVVAALVIAVGTLATRAVFA